MTNNPLQHRLSPASMVSPLKLKARYDNFIGGEWVALPTASITRI